MNSGRLVAGLRKSISVTALSCEDDAEVGWTARSPLLKLLAALRTGRVLPFLKTYDQRLKPTPKSLLP